jgi:hypothetical protein
MRFQMPESLDGLSIADLDKLYLAGLEETQELAALGDAEITDVQLDELDALNGHLDVIAEARTGIETAAQERADRLAAARSKVAEASTPAEDPDEDEDGGEDDGEEPEPEAEVADEVQEERELVTASAAPRRRTVAKASSLAPKPEIPVEAPRSVLIAAANLPNIETNHAFKNLSEAAQIWGSFASKGAGGSSTAMLNYDDTAMVDPQTFSKNKQQLGFMRIQKPELEFGITEGMTVEQQLEQIDKAANERTKFGSGGLARAILAAAGGGWCAPSETIYDFCSYETVSGILDIPTINMPRGGIKYSKGPDYATLAASWGFLQTEAQADASTAKVCYPVACPPFVETRLDAIGFCITAGVLTNTTYPELIRRVFEIGTVAHAHKVNAYVIGKISTAIGAAVNHLETGGTISDVLEAIDLQAQRVRYQLAMAEGATLEVVLPVWAKSILRADLGRRTGINELGVTDGQLETYFAVRGVRVQWVFDYQPLDSTSTTAWTKFPAALEFMMYPAGAFVKGALPVIDLDTIYDSVGLSTNTYTAAFFEEGVQVFNRCGFGVKASVDITKLSGRTGANDITP